MSYLLWAVDPGTTVGNRLLIVEDEFGVPSNASPYDGNKKELVQQPQMKFLERVDNFLGDCVLRGGMPIHFQVETFTITLATAKKGAEPDPIHVIGTLRYLFYKYETWCTGNVTFGYSRPDQVMQLFPNEVLKRLNLYIPGKGHANDAARHAGFYLLKHNLISYADMHGPGASLTDQDGEDRDR